MNNKTSNSREEYISRYRDQKEKSGYSSEQLAVLIGISIDTQKKIEAGERFPNIEYYQALKRLGFDPVYISHASDDEKSRWDAVDIELSRIPFSSTGYFTQAVQLMCKSKDAVEAFMGEGMAKKHPELITSLMNATVGMERNELMPGPGGIEEHADKIADAIHRLAAALEDGEDDF
jgi:transcriptional regulator with XRE-family HTH domain